jgi:hypothetical protein
MRVTYKRALWVLVMLPFLQGCHQKQTASVQPQTLPPILDSPPPRPATVSPADLPPPVVGTTQPTEKKDTTKVVEPPKKPVRHVKKPTPTPATETKPVQEAANTTPPPPAVVNQPVTATSVPAAGQLSGGASGDVKNETEDSINNTEKGLNGVTRSLSSNEAKTAAQIREFLKQARDALNTGDADGARTLVSKAKVLLTELTQ